MFSLSLDEKNSKKISPAAGFPYSYRPISISLTIPSKNFDSVKKRWSLPLRDQKNFRLTTLAVTYSAPPPTFSIELRHCLGICFYYIESPLCHIDSKVLTISLFNVY